VAWPPSLQDFYALALSPAACVPDTRSVRSIDVGSQLFELPGHGLFGGETLYFQTMSSSGALPAGLSPTLAYLAVRRNSHFFGITNLDGSPASFTDIGSGPVNLLEDMEPVIMQMLARRTSDVQSSAKAYKPPYSGDVPIKLIGLVVDLTAFDVAGRLRVASPQFSIDDLRTKYVSAEAERLRLDGGVPLAETVTDTRPTVAKEGAVLVPRPCESMGVGPGEFRA